MMEKTMADDPIDALAVGIAEDHKAAKRRKSKEAAAQAGDAAAAAAEDAGATHAQGEAAGGAAEETVDEGDASSVIASRIENISEDVDFAPATLVGDLRDSLLDLFKTRSKSWSQMLEDEQKTVVRALEYAAKNLVAEAVKVITAADASSFEAKLESYTEKGAITIKLTAESTRENVVALHDAVDRYVLVKRIDPTPHMGERKAVTTDPDAPEMAFDAEAAPAKADHPDDDSDLAGDDPFDADTDVTVRDADGELVGDE